MDPDLQDLLLAWAGEGIDEARRGALLARLGADAEFRRAFIEEVRLLGMIGAVQAAEPRWLALADELGWGAAGPADPVPLEDRVLDRLRAEPVPRTRAAGRWRWAALAAGVLAAAAPVWLFLRDGPRPAPAGRAAPANVAVVVKVEGVELEAGAGPVPAEGRPLPAGPFRLRSGHVTMTLYSGVMLSVEGPASLDLSLSDGITCQRGRVRARVPAAAASFVVRTPCAMVSEAGTEYGVNVGADGRSEVMVFDGRAEVSVLGADGRTLRSELVEGQRAVVVEPGAARIGNLAAAPGAYLPAPVLTAPTLLLDRGYADEVLGLKPWGYWRFEDMADRAVRNEVAGRPPLRATGAVRLAGVAGVNRSAAFAPARAEQYLVADGSWAPPRGTGYAVEAWVLPEEVSMQTVVALSSRADEPVQKHVFLLELSGRGHHLAHDACVARYLDRWPPAHGGGVNVFSRERYVPFRWNHLVACRLPDRLELYVNGELAGTSSADPGDETTPCRLMVGRLKRGAQPGIDQERAFVGRIDELAVYDRPLTAGDVRRHYELGAGGK
ncbi:LamG domain-containing protein [Gemmata sp.]|uniref:LamG domain-containing protein n=1 Tax=Gemmata sp. TaxID=1914242 RepID=UPI003F718D8C